MVLTPTERVEPDDGSTRSLAVTGFVTGVLVLSALLLGGVLALQLPRIAWSSAPALTWLSLTVLLVLGELRPLLVLRRDGSSEPLTVSTTFALALVLVGPLSVAMLAQALAVTIDDVGRRRSPLRAAFNVGQYMITLVATRIVFALAAGHPILATSTPFLPHDLLPAVLAAVTFLLANNGLVALVVALDQGLDPLRVLVQDLRAQALTSAILLGLAPVAVVIAEFTLLMVPLLVLPLTGVQRNAWIAASRQHEALHDGLTALPNRELFRLRAERALNAARGARHCAAVMLLDLDHFKEVNDTLGHHVGDGLLRKVAERISMAVPPDVTVARLGGDEFAVLMPAAPDLPAVLRLAKAIADQLREPVVADGVRLGVQGSIGVAVFPDHADSVDMLLQRADIALYRAKDNRGETQVYRPEIDQHTVLRLSLLGDLHAAVDNDEFEMHYQPQVDARSGNPVAIEALMRWQHPVHGMVRPDVFIPLAESTGLIGPMSRTAVESSLAMLGQIRGSGHDVSMAVNVSARLLSDLELPRWIGQALMNTSIPSSRLTIEVTESTITADPKRAMQVLHDLRELGVRLAIDDFGTGYSSLSYLRRLQPDELKVDKSFVTQLRTDENSAVIVRSTIELGHGLGLSVVAEGVEDAETYDALASLGCDRIQGYHVARPLTGNALKAWLDAAAVSGQDGHPTGRAWVRQVRA